MLKQGGNETDFQEDRKTNRVFLEENPEMADSAIADETEKPNPENEPQDSMKKIQDKLPEEATPKGIELYRQGGLPGNRPIGLSNFEISDSINLSGNRPVEASNFIVADTLNSSGIRPIGASMIHVAHSMQVSGNRPITESTILMNCDHLMGNRPICSNEGDDTDGMMGFLD
ncbi:hypothetical protein [Oscillatoria acuminata]|nr:hypothetical protein [Oscillatoria acuminata]